MGLQQSEPSLGRVLGRLEVTGEALGNGTASFIPHLQRAHRGKALHGPGTHLEWTMPGTFADNTRRSFSRSSSLDRNAKSQELASRALVVYCKRRS